MFSAYFLNRRYAFTCYSLLLLSTILVYINGTIKINLTKFGGEYTQLLSDCSAGKFECSVFDTVMLLIRKLSWLLIITVIASAINSYSVLAFIFYWRQALTEQYLTNWHLVYNIEGSSQRVQEDTKEWAKQCRLAALDVINSLVLAFKIYPELSALSSSVPEVFLFGRTKLGAFAPPIFIFSINFLVIIVTSYKLPKLSFENQRLEASFRKELVLAEDTNDELNRDFIDNTYNELKINYFSLFRWTFPFAYFNLACRETTLFLGTIFIWPSFFSGSLTTGTYSMIEMYMASFVSVLSVIQRRWRAFTTMMAIYRRLNDFEIKMKNIKDLNTSEVLKPVIL